MNRSERAVIIILRVVGVSALFAVPAIFFPYSWMNTLHQYAGLGEMPDAAIVSYLARSLSAFYAILGAIGLGVSQDVRRYRPIIKLLSVITVITGVILLGIDLHAALPLAWTLCEGPPTIAVGLLMLWLQSGIREFPQQSEE